MALNRRHSGGLQVLYIFRCLLFLFLVFGDITLLIPSPVVAIPSSRHNNGHVNSPSRKASSRSSSSSSGADSTGYLQIIETEVWDASTNSWLPGGGRGSSSKGTELRWTDEQGRETLSPADAKAPKGYDFVSEWKIVVETGRDSLGWEYQFRYLQPPKRRRIWLRSIEQKQNKPISKHEIMAQLHQQHKRQRDRLSTVIQSIKDDFNFKGFGFSLYKSLLFPESFGVGLFVPMTMNFDFWDRQPGLPSLGTTIAMYYPPTIVQFLSLSMNVQWLKFVFTRALVAARQSVLFVVYEVLIRGMFLLVSLWLYPFVGRFITLPSMMNSSPVLARPVFNENFSERIGMSLSYRWSLSRGFEWRVSTWHSYLPTFTVYQNIFDYLLPSWLHQRLRESSAKLVSASSSGNSSKRGSGAAEKAVDWWQAHFARLGVSTALPMPDPPHISCSAQLNLSGLFFRKQQQKKDSDSRAVEDDKARTRAAISTTASQYMELEESDDEDVPLTSSSSSSSMHSPISLPSISKMDTSNSTSMSDDTTSEEMDDDESITLALATKTRS